MQPAPPRGLGTTAARGLSALALACSLALPAACSETSPDLLAGEPDARAPVEDAASSAMTDAAFDGRCGSQVCPTSALEFPGCCTAEGTGAPGHALESAGRAPGLCGTDVGELVPSLAGTCVQLDQPGQVASECPAQEPLGGGVRMPGCCTDEGFCGSLESIVGFGCFYAKGTKGHACTPGDDTSDGGAD